MRRTRNVLFALFAGICLVAAALYVAGDFLGVDLSLWNEVPPDVLYAVQTAAILLSLGLVPLSLYLFKIPRIHNELMEHKEKALLKWGCVRLAMPGTLLISNTLLYYLLGYEPAFGYLAIIAAMIMPFIVPTMKRCIAETTPEPTEPEESSPNE